MKTKGLYLGLSLICLFTEGCICGNMMAVKGDGHVITKEIDVPEYDKIEVYGGGSLVFDYDQKDASPYLKITVDENIFDEMEIKVTDGKLTVRPKDQRTHLAPTTYVIMGNSRALRDISLYGGGNFNVNSALHADELELDVAGSGIILLKDTVTIGKLKTEIAGSGTINSLHITGPKVQGEIAGSGTIILNGTIESGNFEIAGSGDVKAVGCQFTDVSCEIAGSGNIEVAVSGSLNVEIAGSGYVGYKGNPSIRKDIAGIGRIKRLD